MKPSSAKAKGRNLQKVLRDAILGTFTSLSDRDVRSTSMGVSGVDIQLSRNAVEAFPYSAECKALARIAIYSMYDQSCNNCAAGTTPLLVIKQNHSQPLAVVSLEHFMELVSRERISSNRNGTGESNL